MSPRGQASRAAAGGAGRVIAGDARGRRLLAPGEGTRPLGDRVKQTLFAILEPTVRGRPFLDLFAGSGAAGIEALSRGASKAVFVDSDKAAIATIERNLDATGLAGARAEVSDWTVDGWLARATGLARVSPETASGPFGAILVDPPYDSPSLLDDAVRGIVEAGPGVILAKDGVLVLKYFWKTSVPEVGLLRSVREQRFGETKLTFFRWADQEDR